ncbi:unnamed protein product [Boreogadus saida]
MVAAGDVKDRQFTSEPSLNPSLQQVCGVYRGVPHTSTLSSRAPGTQRSVSQGPRITFTDHSSLFHQAVKTGPQPAPA